MRFVSLSFALRLTCLTGLLAVIAAPSYATTAEIRGTVSDPTGAVVPQVRVVAENLETRLVRWASTDESGHFVIPLLPPGRYTVKAEAPGFKVWSVPEVILATGDRLRLDIQMEVGTVEQTIEVTAVNPALQSDSVTLGTLVNERGVQDLPLVDRNFIRLAQLAAGAHESVPNALSSGNRPDDRRRTSAVAVNGQRDYVNNFMIDGMDNNERSIGSVVVKPSMEALAEFRVMTNMYSAELGRTAGGVINLITKSGTNEFHGSLYEFLRNSGLDAKNFFAPPGPTPHYRQNQFGGSLGGPIVRNRTFFFADYEGLRVRQAQTFVSTVPTEPLRRGEFAGVNPIFDPLTTRQDPANPARYLRDPFPGDRVPAARMDPVALRYVSLYPAPQRPGLANNFTHTPVKTQRDDTFDVRMDQRMGDAGNFFARYSFNDTETWLPPHLPKVNVPGIGELHAGGERFQFAGTTPQRSQGLHLNYNHTFRPNLVGEFRAGYARFALATLPPNYGRNVSESFGIRGANFDIHSSGLTPVAIPGFRGLGDSNWIPMFIINNTFQYVGSLNYIRGGHNLKLGGDFRRRQFTVFQGPEPRGEFLFDANFTNDPTGTVRGSGNAFASFLLGYPASTGRRNHLVWPGLRSSEFAAYLQDDWRASRRLTLNLGVRYEVFTPFTEVANRIANVDLRAGRIIVAGQGGASRTVGIRRDWNDVAPRFGFAYSLGSRTVLRGGYGLNFYAANYGSQNHFRMPPFVSLFSIVTTPLFVSNRMSDGLPLPTPTDPTRPRGALTGVSLDVRTAYVQQYNLTLQRELLPDLVGTVSYVGALGRKDLSLYNVNLATPGPGGIQPRRPYYSLFPDVTAINLVQSFGVSNYHALQTSLERRFRAGFNLIANYTWAHLVDNNPGQNGGKPGAGPFPQLVTNLRLERANSDLDVRHRGVVMANYELPWGRQLTGLPAILLKDWQINGILVLQSGLTFTVFNAAARANTGGGDRPHRLAKGTLPPEQRSVSRWFDTAAFSQQPLFEIGNAGRNILFGPGTKQLDISVFKHVRLTERWKLQFRAEAFNVTNTPNFGVPESGLGTAVFGTINNTANFLPRQLQFALKLLF